MNAGAGRVRSILAGVLLPGLLLVMGPGCERSTEPADGLLLKTRPSFNLGDTLTLAYGEAAENAPTRTVIRFDSVLEDSRCPTHVVCVWEGNARIALDLQEPGGEHRFSLNTHAGYARDTVLAGRTIRLINVLPYPEWPEPRPAQEEYKAILTIR